SSLQTIQARHDRSPEPPPGRAYSQPQTLTRSAAARRSRRLAAGSRPKMCNKTGSVGYLIRHPHRSPATPRGASFTRRELLKVSTTNGSANGAAPNQQDKVRVAIIGVG